MPVPDHLIIIIAIIMFVISVIGVLTGLVGIIWYGIRALKEVKIGLHPWKDSFGNPVNLLYLPDRLTQLGKSARSKMLLSIVILAASTGVAILGDYLLGLL